MATSDSVMVRMLSPLCLREYSKEKIMIHIIL